MHKLILLLILLLAITNSLTCGGNCPLNNCPTCWCGQEKNIVSISEECQKYPWDQRCCQCIMGLQSGGNANAMNQITTKNSKTGLWQLDDDVRTFTCQIKLDDRTSLCSKDINMDCAYKLYQLNRLLGYWNPWRKSAQQCNCLPNLTTE